MTPIIDLSVGAIAYASGCLAGVLMYTYAIPVVLSFLIGILIGVLIGWINSLFIVKFKMNAMLVSLGMMLVIRAAARIVTDDRTLALGDLVSGMRQTRIDVLGDLPVMSLVMVAIVIICGCVLKYTPFGRKLIAVGSSEKGAKASGINVDKIKSSALIICGGVCGIAGCFWIVTLGSVVTTGLASYEFLALAAAVLGGTSLLGGRGSFSGSFVGALIMLFIAAGMANMGIDNLVIPFVRGVIIFLAMYVDSLRTRSMMGSL